ncbi:hypothetical protein F6Y05_40875 [Bacillus megaterium]|nr:hypothetical protein [Priestia megaterium]
MITKRWEEEVSFRHFIRIMAAVWGIGLIIEALVKVVIVYEFPISKALVISPIVQYIIIAILIYWNIHFVKQRKQSVNKGGH